MENNPADRSPTSPRSPNEDVAVPEHVTSRVPPPAPAAYRYHSPARVPHHYHGPPQQQRAAYNGPRLPGVPEFYGGPPPPASHATCVPTPPSGFTVEPPNPLERFHARGLHENLLPGRLLEPLAPRPDPVPAAHVFPVPAAPDNGYRQIKTPKENGGVSYVLFEMDPKPPGGDLAELLRRWLVFKKGCDGIKMNIHFAEDQPRGWIRCTATKDAGTVYACLHKHFVDMLKTTFACEISQFIYEERVTVCHPFDVDVFQRVEQ